MEGGAHGATEEAFRAAHTIKGLAAAMGEDAVSARAHALEDLLSGALASKEAVGGTRIDELLEAADALAAAIAHGATALPPDAGPVPAPPATYDGGPASVPEGTVRVVNVRLRPETPLRAARAALVRSHAERCGGVLGAWPPPGADTDSVVLFLGAGADEAAIGEAVRRAGDILDVAFEAVEAPRVAPSAPAAPAAASYVRVDRAYLDALAESVAELSVLHERARTAGPALDPAGWQADRVGALLAALRRTVLDMRMVPVGAAFDRFNRLVRDAARTADRDVAFTIEGAEIELDQAVLDAVVEPLVHLLRNAVDHGIEPREVRLSAGKPVRGSIRLAAARDRQSVRFTVEDDGGGIHRDRVAARARDAGLPVPSGEPTDDELLRLLAQPGFSTAAGVTTLSGRGIGLDVVVDRLRRLGGAIDLETRAGSGTTFTLRVPLTLALAHALRVRVGGEDYAIPLTHVTEAIALDSAAIEKADADREVIRVRGAAVPLVRLGRVLCAASAGESAAVVAEAGDRRVALGVDELVGHEQILVKPFDAPVNALPVFSGATLLADGRPALLIDPLSVA